MHVTVGLPQMEKVAYNAIHSIASCRTCGKWDKRINSGKIVIENYIRNARFQFETKNLELNLEKTMMTGII